MGQQEGVSDLRHVSKHLLLFVPEAVKHFLLLLGRDEAIAVCAQTVGLRGAGQGPVLTALRVGAGACIYCQLP